MIIIDFNWNVGISRPPLIISSRNNAHSVSATPLNIVNTKSPTVWNICGYIIEILIIIKFVIILLKYLCILIVFDGLMVCWKVCSSITIYLFITLYSSTKNGNHIHDGNNFNMQFFFNFSRKRLLLESIQQINKSNG